MKKNKNQNEMFQLDEKRYSAYEISIMFNEIFDEIKNVCSEEQQDRLREFMNMILCGID